MALLCVLIALTSYRLTRLVAQDEFPPIAVARERVAGRWGDESWQAYLSRCPWCVGVYASGLVTLAAWLVLDLPVPFLVWGAAAAAVGFLARIDRALDQD